VLALPGLLLSEILLQYAFIGIAILSNNIYNESIDRESEKEDSRYGID
jgi:hypothetical protein